MTKVATLLGTTPPPSVMGVRDTFDNIIIVDDTDQHSRRHNGSINNRSIIWHSEGVGLHCWGRSHRSRQLPSRRQAASTQQGVA